MNPAIGDYVYVINARQSRNVLGNKKFKIVEYTDSLIRVRVPEDNIDAKPGKKGDTISAFAFTVQQNDDNRDVYLPINVSMK